MRSDKPIMLVDDDMVDRMLVERALREIMAPRLETAESGEECLAYLRDRRKEKPAFILLDLNMPRMNGIELLTILKRHRVFRSIPVVILTTSREQKDVRECFRLGAAGYLAKPVDYRQFVEVMRTLVNYWTLNELPE